MGRPPLRDKGAFSAAVRKAKHQVEHVFWLPRQVGKPVDLMSNPLPSPPPAPNIPPSREAHASDIANRGSSRR
jgi:hypothetical protein